MRPSLILVVILMLSQACLKSGNDFEGEFVDCSEEPVDFFEPIQKSFILPAKSGFIDSLCYAADLLSGNLTFPNLDANKVCLLEQHLGELKSYVSEALCGIEVSDNYMQGYKYQYFNLEKEGEPYILVNGFTLPDSSDIDWKTEPYFANCNEGADQWTVLFNLNTLEFEEFFHYLPYSVSILDEFPYGKLCDRCFELEELKPFLVDKKDICKIESRLAEILNVVGEKCDAVGQQVDTNFEYHHQFMGVEQEGEKWIYINAFPLRGNFENQLETREFAHSDFVIACNVDAIGPFYGIFYNIETEKFSDLQFSF